MILTQSVREAEESIRKWQSRGDCAIVLGVENLSSDDIFELVNQFGVSNIFSLSDISSGRAAISKAVEQYNEQVLKSALRKDSIRQNRELESLNHNLESIVQERTQFIEKAKLQEEEKVYRLRQLVKFVKELSQTSELSDLMSFVRKELRKFSETVEIFFLLKSESGQWIYFWHSSHWIRRAFDQPISINSQALANLFGRPVGQVHFHGNSDKFSFSGLVGAFIETHLQERSLSLVKDWLMDRMDSISMAFQRAQSEKDYQIFSKRWEDTFDGLKDPLAVIDSDFRVERANKQFEESHDKQVCYEIFAGRQSPCEFCPLEKSLATGKHATSAVTIRNQFYEVNSFPILAGSISSSKLAVVQYVNRTNDRILYLQTLQNEKMRSIGQLAGHIAHELNNPLTGIHSLAQILASEAEDKNRANDFFEIQKAAERSQRIIQSLLSFANTQSREMKITPLEEVIDNTLPLLKTGLRTHRLKVELGEQAQQALTNFHLLQQVIFNLIKNACESMQSSGVIRITSQRARDQVELLVSDTGPGIPQVMQEKIFEAFNTTKQEGQGTGLGLWLSRDIMRRLGGDLKLVKSDGSGTTFAVILPMEDQ